MSLLLFSRRIAIPVFIQSQEHLIIDLNISTLCKEPVQFSGSAMVDPRSARPRNEETKISGDSHSFFVTKKSLTLAGPALRASILCCCLNCIKLLKHNLKREFCMELSVDILPSTLLGQSAQVPVGLAFSRLPRPAGKSATAQLGQLGCELFHTVAQDSDPELRVDHNCCTGMPFDWPALGSLEVLPSVTCSPARREMVGRQRSGHTKPSRECRLW